MGHDNGSNYDKRFTPIKYSKDYSTISNASKSSNLSTQLNMEMASMMFEDDYDY